jgi:hypothetical protein
MGMLAKFVISAFLVNMIFAANAQDQTKKTLSKADYNEVLQNLNDPQVFQRFLNKLPTITVGQEKRTYYVIEGDLRVTAEELRARLSSYAHGAQPASRSSSDELYVMTRNGKPVKWEKGDRKLTYAVNRKSFSPDQYKSLVDALPKAADEWVKACPECGLSFEHRPEHDASPSLDKVTFIVTYVPNDPRYYAIAFFPSDPVDVRYLQIMPPFFSSSEIKRVGILVHEFGHILGYRHAHIGGVPGCELQEERDGSWVALSPYDSASTMHYLCGGGGSENFEMSDRDRADHKAYYSE